MKPALSIATLVRFLRTAGPALLTLSLCSCQLADHKTLSSLSSQDRIGGVIWVPPQSMLFGNGGLGSALVASAINAARVKDSQIATDETFARIVREAVENEFSSSTSFHYVKSGQLRGVPAFDSHNEKPFIEMKAQDIAPGNDLRVLFKTRVIFQSYDTIFRVDAYGRDGAQEVFGGIVVHEGFTREERQSCKAGTEAQQAAIHAAVARRAVRKFITEWDKVVSHQKGHSS